jgi:tRNA threonylcarbamoyladenosine biosynthesis protein TsaB
MTILGIETATAVCGVALVVDGSVRAERWIEAQHIHSEKLMTLIDDVVCSSGIDMRLLDGIAVSIGPGSFTGLRIGLSVAKGLAFGLDKPILAVPTLEALAWSAVLRKSLVQRNETFILPLLTARRDEVYCALYSFGNETLKAILPPSAMSVGEIEHHIPSHSSPFIVTGDGAQKFYHYLTTMNMNAVSLYNFPVHREDTICSPSAVALIGERKLRTGEVANVATIEPMYVKEFHTLVKTQHLEVQS